MIMKKTGIFAFVLMTSLLLAGCVSESSEISENSAPEVLEIPQNLSSGEIAGLVKMREEEKLARDVYTTLGKQWGSQIFVNISSSEQTHTTEIKNLLDQYSITDPVVTDTVGVFNDSALQKLYTDLVAQGSTSLVNALIVGATIEDLDIADLTKLISETQNQNIISVYTNLANGSRNHLRSFVRNISMNGGVYAPKYISQDEYNQILSVQTNTPSEGE